MSAIARTPEALATVRRLWIDGYSAGRIAETLGAGATKPLIESRLRKMGLTAAHRRQGAPRVTLTPDAQARRDAAAAARAAAREARRVAIWDMAAEGRSTIVIGRRMRMAKGTVVSYIAQGKPAGADWHLVAAEDFPRSLLAAVTRAGLHPVAIMNAAAMRWGVPATALFGRGERSTLRTPAVAAARAEVAARLRHAGLTTPICAAVLKINDTAIIAAVNRVQDERRSEFAALRAELAGGAQ